MLARCVMAIVTALCLVWISTAGPVLAQRGNGGGGKPPKDPPAQTCPAVVAPGDFDLVATLELPNNDDFMFGRPIDGGQINGGPLVFAVGARINANQGQLFIYSLDPDNLPATLDAPIATINVGCEHGVVNCGEAFRAEVLAVADFNDDGGPDFVVKGIGSAGDAVAIYTSTVDPAGSVPTYENEPVFLDLSSLPTNTRADSIAATDNLVVVGAPGLGSRGPAGLVLLYTVSNNTESISVTLIGPFQPSISEDGDEFGTGVALGDVGGDGTLDLIVGAPGVDLTKKIKDQGEVWTFELGGDPPAVSMETLVPGLGKLDRFGAEVAVAGNQAVAATGWNGQDVRAELLVSPGGTLRPDSGFETGWASRGFKTGALNGGPTDDIIIGAPNAPCGGRAYLYRDAPFGSKVIFQPPIAPDDGWTAFGWSSAILGSFVVIGEPGRDVDGVDGANDGQVYVYQYTTP